MLGALVVAVALPGIGCPAGAGGADSGGIQVARCDSVAVTPATEHATDPVVSDAGTHVAFRSDYGGEGHFPGAWVEPLPGGEPRQVGGGTVTPHTYWWLNDVVADGSAVGVTLSHGGSTPSTVFTAQVQRDDGTTTALGRVPDGHVHQPGGGSYAPSLSDDGRTAAYVFEDDDFFEEEHGRADNAEVVRYDLDDAHPTAVTDTPMDVTNRDPSISGDGSAIAFVSDGDITGDNPGGLDQAFLWSDGTTVQVTEEGGVDHVEVSPDGAWVAYRAGDAVGLWSAAEGNVDTSIDDAPTVDVAGGPYRTHGGIDVSDGGQRVVFSTTADLDGTNPGGEPAVYVWHPASPHVANLSARWGPSPNGKGATISADGRSVTYTAHGPGDEANPMVVLSRCAAFQDVRVTHPFFNEIHHLHDAGIADGYADGRFRPVAPLSRQAGAAFLYRAFEGTPHPDAVDDGAFPDLPPGAPFLDEISWLVGEGHSTAYADGTWRPAAPLTRAGFVAWLHRIAGSPEPTVEPGTTFADVGPDHPFATEVGWAVEAGITEGYGDGTFRPGAALSRQAMAALVDRLPDDLG